MSQIFYKQNENTIVLDFPQKEMIYFENVDKTESCYIQSFNSIEAKQLLSPKNFEQWTKYTSSKTSEKLRNISLQDNFLFKGNNLIVLHSILPFFKETIKLIYIDPPYNTGNTFTYKDKFSRPIWLVFMKNRLTIARDFLKNDGILVIQCDENEHAYLKVLLDEIFNEECFLGSITVLTNPSGRDYRSLARTHEYLLIYGKTPSAELYPLILEKEFPFTDKISGFELRNLRNGNIRFHQGNRPNLYYPIYVNPKQPDEFGHFPLSVIQKKDWVEIFPRKSQGLQTVWRWGKEKLSQNISDSTLTSNVVARSSKDTFLIFEKYRKNTRLARTIWDSKDFYTSKGTKQIKEIFGESVFDYPKPELLIAKIIDITTKENDRILDFFVGSGTTVAVAHKAKRKWIGIEQMEYIHNVTIPRLQKILLGDNPTGASNHYKWDKGGSFVYSQLETKEQFPFYKDLLEKNLLHLLKNKSVLD